MQRDMKLVTTDKRINFLAWESNYHTTKCFTENLVKIKMSKRNIKMNKAVYLGLSVLDTSKIAVYEYYECQYDYKSKVWRQCQTMLYGY